MINLLIQGLSLRHVARWLGLHGDPPDDLAVSAAAD